MTSDQTRTAQLLRLEHSLEAVLEELDRLDLSLIAAQLSLPLELLKAELAQQQDAAAVAGAAKSPLH
jgi:hypothetical protein